MADTLAEQRHNLTHAMGECILAWSKVEQGISLLFHVVVGGDYFDLVSAFEAVITLDGRLAMITAAIESKSMSRRIDPWASYAPVWKKMRDKIKDQYIKRNGVAHSDLLEYAVTGKPHEWRLLEFPTTTRQITDEGTLTLARLHQRRDGFSALAQKISDFRDLVEQRQRPPPISA